MINWFKNLPLWLQIVIVVVVAYILYLIYQWIKRKAEAGNYNAAVNQSQTALNQLAQQGIYPSYAQAQYTSMSNALQGAFTGCGTAYDSVLVPTFTQMKNEADIYALIKNYGVRDFDECGWGTFNGDLAAALVYKLTGFTFCPPNNLLCTGGLSGINKILKDNGLLFQF